MTRQQRQSRDAPVLADLLELHATANPQILDCTYGRGAIWGRLPIRQRVIKVDISPDLPDLDLAADWRELPQHYPCGSLDVLVWDPIHVTDVGKRSQLYRRYVAAENPVNGESITHLYPDFLTVASALVKPRTGSCLVKLSDQVHNGRYRWQVFEFVAAAQARGWTACQPKVLCSSSAARDPKHRNRYHMRNGVVYWLGAAERASLSRAGPTSEARARLPVRRVQADVLGTPC